VPGAHLDMTVGEVRVADGGPASHAPPAHASVGLQQEISVAPRWRPPPSQTQHQVADGGRLGQERVVTGVELHDAACPTSELALPFGGSAPVLGADEVRRSHVLPDG
jgi:hypothetical protein